MTTPAKFPAEAWDGKTANDQRVANAYVAPDGDDWDRIAAEVVAIAANLVPGYGLGAKNGAAVAVSETQIGPLKRTVFTITDLTVAMTDATTAGSHGKHKLYDFPAGLILVLGCVTDLVVARVGTAIGAAAAVVGSIGSADVGTDNATLTSTEADIVPSTAATLSSGTGNFDGQSSSVAMIDGTTSAAKASLNLAVPDGDSSGNDSLTVNGTVTLTWVSLGDH